MGKIRKPDIEKALITGATLEMAVMNEVLVYTNSAPETTTIEIDTHKFYEHCYRKFFKKIIDRNVEAFGLDRHFMTYCIQVKFMNAMMHISIYDVEKLRLLELADRFNKEYRDYLNDYQTEKICD